MEITLQRMLKILEAQLPPQSVFLMRAATIIINGICFDTRKLQRGEMFIALKVGGTDGHTYVQAAAAQGASCVLVSEYQPDVHLPQIIVSDTRSALAKLARWYRAQFMGTVIALTGSSGKTTVKEIIYSILSQKEPALATFGNYNNDIGAPFMLCQLTNRYWAAVLELGANHSGEIAYTTQLVEPQVALITNIGPAHLAGFKSIEGVAQAKTEIYEGVNAQGTCLLNRDEPYYEYFHEKTLNKAKLTFGVNNPADFMVRIIEQNEKGQQVIVKTPITAFEALSPLLGKHQAINLAAAVAACWQVGSTPEEIQAGIANVKAVPGRLYPRQGKSSARILDDTYNANPASVKAAIAHLSQYPGQRVLVLGDMGELGENAVTFHQEVGEIARACGIDVLYTYGELSKYATEAFGKPAQHFFDQTQLIRHLENLLNAEVTCLVKGSRAAQMEKVVAGLIIIGEK